MNHDLVIQLQNEYIELLSADIDQNAAFLFTHGIRCKEEMVSKGVELRAKIEAAMEENPE